MPASRFPTRAKTTPRSPALKEAIVACFAADPREARIRLMGFEEADWVSILWWLDINGSAIYFYRRATEIGADGLLPQSVAAGLAQRLSNNRVRIRSLLDEARILTEWFKAGNIPFALLKGATLTPHSIQESALRCQTDLDFLVPDRFADLAAHYIHRLGYRLHAKCGNTLEFRGGAPSPPDLANAYSVKTQRALELHLARESSCESRLLARRVERECDGVRMYALSPADILAEQARHLLKHLCGEHTRLSWVLEFWRHVRSRQSEEAFWHFVEASAGDLINGDLAMAVAAWTAEEFFGGTYYALPSKWRADALPPTVRLWLERYARRLLLSDTIGSKLYALLRAKIPRGIQSQRTTRQILLPFVFPAPVIEAQPDETWPQRWCRYCVETRFILWRLWFHLREGVRYAIESSRWRRAEARTER